MLSALNSFTYTIYMATISKKKHLQAYGMTEQSCQTPNMRMRFL